MAPSKKFRKNKKAVFDYAKHSIFDSDRKYGQFTIETIRIDSRAKYVMKINENKASLFIYQAERKDVKIWKN